jgi:RHS repeat-associated protein
LTAVSPAGSSGSVDVTVTTPNGTSATSSADTFTYGTPPDANVFIYNPNVSSAVSPTAAQTPAGVSIAVGALIVASGGATNDVTDYTYDAAGNLLTTTVGAGTSSAAITSYCYDSDENKTAVVAADGNVSTVATCSTSAPFQTSSSYQTGYKYDSLGELVTQDAPATTSAPSGQITTYGYDLAGNQLTLVNPNGVTTTSTYSTLSQLASVSYSDGTHSVQYTYDADGNMTGMVDASGTTTNVYDPFDELTSATNGAGALTSYSYDVDGDNTGITYPLGSGATWATTDTVAYAYDHADQMASVTDFNGHTSSYTTTADGLPSALTLGASGDTVSTSYAANDAPTSITLGNGSTLQQFSYSDAPSGAIASETDLPSSSLSPAAYTYNAQSQVTQDRPGSGSAKSYALDASGNLTTIPTGASGTYNAGSQLTSSALSGATASYTYDAAGNRTGESVAGTSTVSATYNGTNQLTSYDNSAANMSAVTYNGQGMRTSSTATPSGGSATTQNFTWDTASSSPSLLMDSTNAYIYGVSDTPIEQVNISTGTIRYLDADALGSVRGVVSSSGSLSASTSYDAWGNPETSGGLTSYTPFGFATGYSDVTQLIYLVNRYYDPTAGQFITMDPMVIATGQAYSYTGGNPVNAIDPLGLSWYNPASWSSHTWRNIGVGVGIVLGVAAAATGVGAIVEGATASGLLLGGGSLVLGAGATTLDYGPCVNGHDSAACVGLGLGATGVFVGAFGTVGAGLVLTGVIAEDSLIAAILQGIGAFGWNVGIAGTVFDSTTGVASAYTLSACNAGR